MKYLLYFLLARPRPKIYSKGPDVGSKDAKQAALAALDACPVDVIRKFVNRSWQCCAGH